MRLHRWLGVDVRFTGAADRSSVDAGIEAVAAELRAAGRRPYLVPARRGDAAGRARLRAGEHGAGRSAGGLDEPPAGLWLATGSVRDPGRAAGRGGADRCARTGCGA